MKRMLLSLLFVIACTLTTSSVISSQALAAPDAPLPRPVSESKLADSNEVSAGGGCRTYSGNFASYSSCIGDDGVYVYGDGYVNSYNNCLWISITVWERTGNWHEPVASSGTYKCRTGHFGPVTYRMVSGRYYYTEFCFYIANVGCYLSPRTSPEAW